MFDDLLVHRARVYRQRNSQDASGGTVRTWVARNSRPVNCLIRGLSGNEQLIFSQRNIVVSHSIYFRTAGAAETGDKVIDADGENYMLVSLQKQQGVGNIETFYFWLAREMLPGE